MSMWPKSVSATVSKSSIHDAQTSVTKTLIARPDSRSGKAWPWNLCLWETATVPMDRCLIKGCPSGRF